MSLEIIVVTSTVVDVAISGSPTDLEVTETSNVAVDPLIVTSTVVDITISGSPTVLEVTQTPNPTVTEVVVGPGGTGVTPNTVYPVLIAGDISAKKITLASAPLYPAAVMVDIIRGGPQAYSIDFVVSGADISWDGLGLDGLVGIGDMLRVHYYT